MIDKNTLQNTLFRFGIRYDICTFYPLQEASEDEKEKRIILVQTINGNKYVCRYYGGSHFSQNILEQQSRFACVLQNNGIITPNKYNSKGRYCLPFDVGNKKYLTTVEDYLDGNDFEIDLQLFEKIGRLLGCLHRISEEIPAIINYAPVTNSILCGKARFEALLNRAKIPFEKNSCITSIASMHDELVGKLSKCWCMLPSGSVHGDLSIFNNIVEVGGNIGIIDFDLAGNEPFLSDLLITFYSSLYKYYTDSEKTNIDAIKAYKMFFGGYLSQRELTKTEISVFSEIAALFDGLYFSKMLISEWNRTQKQKILDRFEEAQNKFDTSIHLFEWGN